MTHAGVHPDARVCPVELAIHVIGGKWKLLVLRSLLLDGAQRYNSLLRNIPNVSPKELTRNLRELERTALIVRKPGETSKPDVEVYSLTELGSSLLPAFQTLGAFGELLARSEASRELKHSSRPPGRAPSADA